MKRKITSTILAICILIMTINVTAVASPKINENTKMEKIQRLVEKYGLVLDESYDGEALIEIDDFEALEVTLQEFVKENTQIINKEYEIIVPNNDVPNEELQRVLLAPTIYSGYKVRAWYAPFWYIGLSLMMFQWKNVGFNYYYHWENGAPRFNSLTNFNSWITGYQVGVSWSHNNSTYYITNYSTSTKATISTYGVLTIGLVFEGITIGISLNQTWNCTYTLIAA